MGKFSKFLYGLLDPNGNRAKKNVFISLAMVVVFVTTYMLILPAITESTDTYCGHTEHKHVESCYETGKTLTCKETEGEGHQHSDSCYSVEKELVCDKTESEGHSHGDACYEVVDVLNCTLETEMVATEDGEESVEHVHGSGCYVQEKHLICDKEEKKGHSHSGACYQEVKTLTCNKEEQEGHHHSDSCYEETEKKLICEEEEHEHSLICYSNPNADLEDAKHWERSIKDVELTTNWAQDVLLIADSQLGYEESAHNYEVVDNKKKGYTRYGAWYGVPYGDWCAMFVSFCINYADIPTSANEAKNVTDGIYVPIDCGCQNWIEKLNSKETPYYYAVNDKNDYKLINDSRDFVPEAGDIIFFNWDNENDADHVGFVYEVKYDEEDETKIVNIKTIEGNSSDKVKYNNYPPNDTSIMGYARLPKNPNEVVEETEEETTKEATIEHTESATVESETETTEEAVVESETETTEETVVESEVETADSVTESETEVSEVASSEATEEIESESVETETAAEETESEAVETESATEETESEVVETESVTEAAESEAVESAEAETETEPETTKAATESGAVAGSAAEADISKAETGASKETEAASLAGSAGAAEGTGTESGYAPGNGNSKVEETEAVEATEDETEEGETVESTVLDSEAEETETAEGADESETILESESETENMTEEEADAFCKVYEGPDYTISVRYTKEAEIPDDASLLAEEYDKESSNYKMRYEEMAQIYGWDDSSDHRDEFRLFNIGFYVNNESSELEKNEIEPKSEVQVVIVYKNIEMADDYQVTHFGETTEMINTDAVNDDGDAVISFQAESFSDYGVMALAAGDGDYHVCSSDEIAHVSLDGRKGWQWRENTTDDTGNATYRNRTGNTSRNNALANGAANQAPVKPIAGNIYPISAKMVSTERDDLTISGNPNGTPLIKGKGHSEFAFDFWVEPTAKPSTDNNDFALFEIGSINSSGSTRNTLTAAMPKNNNNPKQIVLAAPNNKSITINLSESIINQWVHIYVTYSGSEATLWVENADGKVLGKGTLNTALTVSGLFDNQSVELIDFANIKNNTYFNGFMDEIIFYNHALTAPSEGSSGGTNHPKTAITKNISATGVGLYNVNTKGGDAAPLAGVEYTVYKSDGSIYGTYTTINEYVLSLGILPAGTYTIEQTAVPEGYVLVPQTKSFTVSANADNLTQAGLFYDYYSGESFNPSKTGEVYDYENRIYDIILSAQSGSYEKKVDPKNFNFVVDQSNSMLFPAVLTDTGARVTLHSVSDGNNSTTNDASGNSSRLDRVMSQNNLDPNKLYYIKALDSTKSTVYAVWKSADGHWYAQDAAYYAQAQAGVHHDSEARDYQYADNPNYTDNNTKVVDGGGCLDGINREAHESGKGNSISGMSDLWKDIQEFGTANNNVSNNAGTDHYKSYVIYTGSEMNRLTYLKYAIKRLIYQLASMDSKNQVTITSFDKYVEGCMTREVDTANPQGVIDLVTFVDGIQTAGGTAQNYGIAHIMGDHATNGNKTNCPGGHLDYTVDGKRADDYIVLITDGALNNSNGNRVYSSSNSGATEEAKQELDLKAGANKFKQNGQNPKLITIGLSVQDVTWGKQLLDNASKNGIATDGYAFLDINADDLAITLSNALIGQLIELEKKDDYANIRDYISDSFYLVDTDGTELKVNDWIDLSGQKVNSNATDKAGQVGKDDNGWYVEWKNQTLGDGLAGSSGGTYTKYSYRDDNGTVTENLNTNLYYIINYDNGRAITGSATSRDSSKDMLYFDQSTGKWTYWWRYLDNNNNRKGDPGTCITSTTAQGSPIWQGKIYVKAKEDFIGGNVIDANKTFVSDDGRQVTEGAQISLLEAKNSNTVISTIQLPTPTLNVRLLPIEGFESEETVFLGDKVENIEVKIKTLLEKTVVNKIKFGLQDPLNKSGMGEDDGVYEKYFTLPYAIRELTTDEWSALRNGESVRVDYTYDDASSHGAVGYFEFKLTKEGDESNYSDHTSEETGEDVEKYILKVTYTAYKQGEEDQDGIKRPGQNAYNASNGPGTEVGGSNAGNSLETGKGTESVDEIHHVHVIDGEIFLTKVIADSMKSDQDQTYTFEIYVKNSETGDAAAEAIKTVTVTVPAGKTQGTVRIADMPRNNYIVRESESDDYVVTKVEVISGDTTCLYETSTPTLEFDIGTNKNSNGTNPDHNVIIFNSPLPNYENSMWVEGERYVYSKPFTKTGTENSDSEGGNTSARPGYHTETREVETYAWESGTIISTDTSGSQYSRLTGTTSSLDDAHTNYGVLTQNSTDEDDWTVTWTAWTSNDETSTTYDWPVGTLISTNTSGSQYQRLTNTQSYYDNNHTSYGILKKNNSGNWVIEWHTWNQTGGSSSGGSNVTITFYNWRYGEATGKTISVPANKPVTISYTIDTADVDPCIWTGGAGYSWDEKRLEVLTKTKVSGTSNRYTVTFTPTEDTWFAYSYSNSNSVSTFVSSSGAPTWSDSTRTENATVSKLPTTTVTNTTWSKGTSAVKADNSKIPKTTKTIEVEVEDEPEETEPGTETVVDGVTITTLSVGHGVITNAPAKYKADISVQKKWDTMVNHDNDIVYVVLVNQDGTPVKDDSGAAKMVKLDAANEFAGKFTIPIPSKGFDPIKDGHYEIREVNRIETIEFQDSAKAMLIGEQEASIVYYVALAAENSMVTINDVGYKVNYQTNNNTLVVTNSKAYELPESGGIGTGIFRFAGMMLILAAGMLLLKQFNTKGRLR